MSSKTFLTISKAECLIVYSDILENSDRKWDSALQLAAAGSYGEATSLAIISMEELVKAIIVLLDGKGFKLRSIKGIDTLFKNHQIRYVIAFAMAVMSMFSDELMKFFKKLHQDPEKMFRIAEQVQKDEDFFEKNFKTYVYRKFVVVKREFKWFSKADFYRQDGFYCDYQDRFKTPISITEKEFGEVLERLTKVRLIGKGIIESFNTTEQMYSDQLDFVKLRFVEEDYYGKIEGALATVKQTRQNPFELIIQYFKP